MLWFLFGFFLVFFINALFNANKALKHDQRQIIMDIKKVCPPHKWFYQEIKDPEGNTRGWKMVCEICGPLKPLDTPKSNNLG